MPIPWAAIPPAVAKGFVIYEAVDEARQQVCELFRDYPETMGRVTGLIPGAGALNPLIPIICPDVPNPPAAPVPPFQGGQCCGIYEVDVSFTIDGTTTLLTYTVPGQVGSPVWVEEPTTSPGRISGGWFLPVGRNCAGSTPGLVGIGGGTNLLEMPSAAIVAVRRIDGIDDCGDPPPRSPQPSGPPPLNFDIEVGTPPIQIPFSISFNAPPINFNFEPQITIEGPEFTFVFGLDGFDILFPGQGAPGGEDGEEYPDPRPPDQRPPNATPPLFPPTGSPGSGNGDGGDGGDGGDCPDVNLQPVLNAIANLDRDVDLLGELVEEVAANVEELLDCDRCSFPSPEDCVKSVLGSGQGGKFFLPARTRWVEVEVTTRPSVWKGYLNPGSPDVVFAGWCEVGSASLQGERTPLQYSQNIRKVEEGFNSFSYGLQTEYSGIAYAYVEKEEEESL